MAEVKKAFTEHKNLIQNTSGAVASIGLEYLGKRMAGTLITPATWALNYLTDNSSPSVTDLGIYASGFLSAPAAISVGTLKAVLDDDLTLKLNSVRGSEPKQYRQFISACNHFGPRSPQINAMTIASLGGTSWKTENGIWVYITDARGFYVADYIPTKYVQLYRPKMPLDKLSTGKFKWTVLRK